GLFFFTLPLYYQPEDGIGRPAYVRGIEELYRDQRQIRFRLGPASIIETNSNGWFPDTDGALITGLTFLDPKDATQVQGLFRHLQVRFGDGPWQDVKGLDEVGSDTGRTGE
ncbi:phage tail fiber C-terminal domain-containing protein, partial [Escherichia coli]|uniref:phage tail fiber C-terminal domain-containing protein n=1 Tax=Escherichia coli TaxID=562 RepID=UPI00207BA6D7